MPIFDVTGTILDRQNLPIPDVHVTVYEKDAVRDDLLGIVRTDARGVFRLRFTEAEFHQHRGEWDGEPELAVVVWREEDGEQLYLGEASFEHHSVKAGQQHDLGEVILARDRDALAGDPDKVVYRGTRDRGLVMDQEVLDFGLKQILPLVEEATGWAFPENEVDCVFTDNFSAVTLVWGAFLSDSLDEITVNPWRDWFSKITERQMYGGLYDPISKKIYINAAAGKILGLEPFVVLLGHELVHQGQFTHHPELLERLQDAVKRQERCDTLLQSGYIAADFAEFASSVGIAPLMTDLEGHASYVERDFLAREFGGTLPPELSLLMRLFLPVFQNLSPGDFARIKGRQYNLGRRYFLDAQGDSPDPIPFSECVSFKEHELLEQEDEVWSLMEAGEWEKAISVHRGLLKRHRLLLGTGHLRHDDIMFHHGVLLAANTDEVQRASDHFKRHVQALENSHGAHSPRTLRAKFRAATTLSLNGASAAAWRYYENLTGKFSSLAEGLNEANEWFDAGFRAAFLDHALGLANELRKDAGVIAPLYENMSALEYALSLDEDDEDDEKKGE